MYAKVAIFKSSVALPELVAQAFLPVFDDVLIIEEFSDDEYIIRNRQECLFHRHSVFTPASSVNALPASSSLVFCITSFTVVWPLRTNLQPSSRRLCMPCLTAT